MRSWQRAKTTDGAHKSSHANRSCRVMIPCRLPSTGEMTTRCLRYIFLVSSMQFLSESVVNTVTGLSIKYGLKSTR